MKVVSCIFLVALSPKPSAFAAEERQQKRVLILYSFENEVGLFSDFDESLRTTLKSGGIGRIEFHTEFLELARFPAAEHENELETLLRSKYSTEQIDLVIPVSLPAIDFVLSRTERLFPNIPVVLCAVDRRWIERLTLPSNVTGVVETTKITKTVVAALHRVLSASLHSRPTNCKCCWQRAIRPLPGRRRCDDRWAW
jgi:ABC-type uncharacterized transport system substrate-binding protein